MRQTRPISWIKAARKEFERFPAEAQMICVTALTFAAEGGKADTAKPLLGMGSAVFEIALPYRGDAYRVVCSSAWRRRLGGSCVPEEIDAGDQDTEA